MDHVTNLVLLATLGLHIMAVVQVCVEADEYVVNLITIFYRAIYNVGDKKYTRKNQIEDLK